MVEEGVCCVRIAMEDETGNVWTERCFWEIENGSVKVLMCNGCLVRWCWE